MPGSLGIIQGEIRITSRCAPSMSGRRTETIFKIFPAPVLGVILFLTGAQLALGSCDFGKSKEDRFVSLVTAGCAVWNIGLAFVIGVATYHLLKRRWVKL